MTVYPSGRLRPHHAFVLGIALIATSYAGSARAHSISEKSVAQSGAHAQAGGAGPAPVVKDAVTQSIRAGDIVITSPWARATPGGAKVAGSFLTLTNTGKTADRLLGGTSSVAGRVEIHEMSVDGGVMRMRELQKGLEIPPGATVELKPGSYHIMMMGLTTPLKEGATFDVTLNFAHAGKVNAKFIVGGIAARNPPGMPAADMPNGATNGNGGTQGMPAMQHDMKHMQ